MPGFFTFSGPEGGLAGVIRRAKQIAAGAYETTVANSAIKQDRNSGVFAGSLGYRPAIIDQPLSLVGTIAALTGHPADPNSMVGNAMRRSRVASLRANRQLGITDPQNTAETALRLAGSMIVPGPKGASIIPKAAKGASYLSRGARAVGRTAVEMGLPLNQTGAKGAAAATALGTGIVETVNKVAPISGYEGVADDKSKEQLDFERDLQPSTIDEEQALNKEVPIDEEGTFNAELRASLDQDEEQHKLNRFEQGAIAVGVVLGGYATMKALRGVGSKALENGIEDAELRFTGKQFLRSRSGVGKRLTTALVRADQPIRDIVDDTLSPDRAAKYGWKLDLLNNVSIGARLRDQFLTGRTVHTGMRTPRLAPLADAFAKELSPEEQLKVSDALLAASALDDFKNTGTLSALNLTRSGASTTPKELEGLVQSVRNDPKLSKYMDTVQQSYRDKLRYELQRGLISQKDFNDFVKRRPNYVEMNRNLQPDADPLSQERHQFSANRTLGAARSTDELGGVQGDTGVANPFHSLFGSWAHTVRNAELNDIRSNILRETAANSPLNADGKPIIQQLPRGQKPYKMEAVHQVFENGEVVNYRVRDPMLNKALHFAPRATAGVLENMRQFYQGLTTGPVASLFNMFAVLKSPVYDTTMGLLLRPRGMAAPGIINEATGFNLPDPTALLGAYSGAVRYMFDDMRGRIATNVASHLYRDNSWMRTLLGDAKLQSISDTLEQGYENSIKSELDRLGAASHTLHGSPDPSKVATGVEDIVPAFNHSALDQLNRDITDATLKGDIGPFKSLLLRGKNRFAAARSTPIAAAYQGVMEAMHNGFRYQALATNKSRIADLDRLGSNLRRLSADAAQHGGSDTANKVFGSFMYANLGVQSLYELGKMVRNDPTRAIVNIGSVMGTLVALHYGGILSDPDAMERHKNKSPHQKLTSLTTFGSAEIPLDPVARLFTSLMFPVLDHVSGAADGKINPDFIGAIDNWLQGHETQDEKERYIEDQHIALWDAVKQNNPLDPTGVPFATGILGGLGIDTGMTRITGEPSMVRPQNVSGLDPDASSPDGIGSAYMENLIQSVFSSTGQALYEMTDDMYRAYGQTGSIDKAREVAGSRYKDIAIRGSAIARPLFGKYESVKGLADTNFELMKDRRKGIDDAIKVYRKNLIQPDITGMDVRYARILPTEADVLKPEVRGTELEAIVIIADALEKNYLSKYHARLADLSEENETIKNSYLRKVEDRNKMQNALIAERKHLNFLSLQATRRYEDIISKRIGKPFRFDDFDPKDYMQPIGSHQ